MASTCSSTSFTDLHPHIIQTQILPRLDGQSLSSAATVSSYLRALCADDILWSDICKSTWPSITHPRIHHLISTFSAGHRSFFQDSFQPPITDVKHPLRHHCCSSSQPGSTLRHYPLPSELISAVDIRYHDDIIYSRVEFTDTTTDFRSSAFKIVLEDDPGVTGMHRSIDLKVDELVHADDAAISHLKESVTLNWILIDPTRKRAVNLSSIKPVLAWITNDIHIRYAVVLPGCDSNELVECRIEVTLAVGKGEVSLKVREVTLHVQDVGCNCVTGKEFLVITRRAFLEINDIREEAGVVVDRYRNDLEIYEIPFKKNDIGKVKGGVLQMTSDETKEKLDIVSDTFTLNSLLIRVLFDLGAMFSFVSSLLTTQLINLLTLLNESIVVELADINRVMIKEHFPEC